jgi:hypothetical protein
MHAPLDKNAIGSDSQKDHLDAESMEPSAPDHAHYVFGIDQLR